MTGYGCGEASQDGWKVTVELSSVNRKQSEIAVNLPRELEVLEAQIRDEINRRIARGRVTVRLTLHASDEVSANRVRVNASLARAYARQLRDLAKQLKLSGDLTIETLVRAPGVLESEDDVSDAEEFWPAVEAALKSALGMMMKMREREGTHLAKDLAKRISTMRKSAAQVAKQAPQVQKRYREQLLDRVRKAGLPAEAVEEERLLKEVVLFADRSDISEELTRLQSHFSQFDDYAKSAEPVGRTLDFLAQEMNREINTIGSKANDSLISREVVVLKTELEKFREQSMNVE
ncbi:MAG: YicC family protein [Verrucomicrobia bacterium]|nr:YicC family protein [Verrucomicrobiota bacterium]